MTKEETEKLLKAKLYEQRIEELQTELQEIEKRILELNKLKDSLNEAKKDNEILAELGQGVFAKVKVLDEKLFMNIGSQIILKKNSSDIRKIIEEQTEKLNNLKIKKQDEFQLIIEQIQEIIC